MTDKNEFLEKHFDDQLTCLKELSKQIELISTIVDKIIESRTNNSQIFTMGNGGSASTASHFVSDLLKTRSANPFSLGQYPRLGQRPFPGGRRRP